MARVIVYLLTWTCRGTWLHGDARGSFARVGPEQTARFIPANPRLHAWEQSRLSSPPVSLDTDQRRCVEAAIRDACSFREWRVLALSVLSNHVHLVAGLSESPDTAIRKIKARATRALREAGLIDSERPVWTRLGNSRRLDDRDAIARACHYVLHCQ